jgi:DNA-directed RNA polymerase specialized sigma24 family protein
MAAWLTVVVRHAVVDWVRSRAGRRRLFRVIRDLDPLARRVFELYYWDGHRAPEIAEMLSVQPGPRADLAAVLDALERIQSVLTDRHRGELMSLVARSGSAVNVDVLDDTPAASLDRGSDPEARLQWLELEAALAAALAELPAEDAAIARLLFVQGWGREDVRRALHLDGLSRHRVSGIVERLRSALVARGIGPGGSVSPSRPASGVFAWSI